MDKRPAGYLSALPVCLGLLLVATGGWDVRLGCVTPGCTLPSPGPRGSEAGVCACGEGEGVCLGLDRQLLTWLGDSQKLAYGTAGHLAVTEGTHYQHCIEGPYAECGDALWGFVFVVAS